MARTREFDREIALDRALRLFWLKGYDSTSMQNLVDETGVNRASMYATFGNKHALFQAALDRYNEFVENDFLAPLKGAGSGRRRIVGFLESVIEAQISGEHPACLMIKSSLAVNPGNQETRDQIDRFIRSVDDAFLRAVEDAQAGGEIDPQRDALEIAHYLTYTLQAVIVSAAMRRSRATTEAHLRHALKALD
jgi:TetR/AcrR family transcriptional repressor of nem operon